MRNKRILIPVLFLLVFTLLTAGASAVYTGDQTEPAGSGTENDPYRISTADELYWFADRANHTDGYLSAHVVLVNDITFNEGVLDESGKFNGNVSYFKEWQPIGTCEGPTSKGYTGTFDGQGHTISGLYLENEYQNYVGLFGFVDTGGIVKNVNITSSYFLGNSRIGGICGSCCGKITNCTFSGLIIGGFNAGGICGMSTLGSDIVNCRNSGEIVGSGTYAGISTSMYIGGVCGANGGKATNCQNSGPVTGTRQVGGVFGNNTGKVTNCKNSGSVTGVSTSGDGTVTNIFISSMVGGVCGNNWFANMTNCSNSGSVNGNNDVGGVCGKNDLNITNCENSGSVNGNTAVGGLCGRNDFSGTIKNSSSSGAVTGVSGVGGLCGYNNINGTLKHCFSSGMVSGDDRVGGLCGYNGDLNNITVESLQYTAVSAVAFVNARSHEAVIEDCFWLAGTASRDIGGGEGVSTNNDFKTAEQFSSGEVAFLLNQWTGDGAENGKVWAIGADGFPKLCDSEAELVSITVDEKVYYSNAGDIADRLPALNPGQAYFDKNGNYIDTNTHDFSNSAEIYVKDSAEVTLDSANGNVLSSVIIVANSCFTIPTEAPTKPGYIFMGWRGVDGVTYQPGDEVAITGNTSFKAIWANMPDITPGTPDEPDDEPDVDAFPFYDVSAGAWYYDAVKYAWEHELMNGVSATQFSPNTTLNRAMIWTMLARLDGVNTDGGANWYAKAQAWAMSEGVSDGTDPMGAVTREQLVTMLWRYKGEPAVDFLLTAKDADTISDWAYEAIRWAVSEGIIEGDENGLLSPAATAARAQAAAIFMRFIED